MAIRMPHRERGDVLPDLFQVVGFGLAVTGIALISVPTALIVAGVALYVVGGLAARR